MSMKFLDSTVFARIRDRGPQLDRPAIQDLERRISSSLPDDYATFLLRCNGGWFYEDNVVYRASSLETLGGAIGLFFFYGLGRLDNSLDIRRALDVYGIGNTLRRIPKDTIPIASTAGGELLLGLTNGQIYFWERDRELDVKDPDDNQLLVAESFAEFCIGCRYELGEDADEYTIEDEEPFKSIELRDLSKLKKFLNDGFPISQTNKEGQTLLYVACRELDLEGAIELLKRGANPGDGDHSTGNPPLWAAASAGACDLAEVLVSSGASRSMGKGDTRLISESTAFPIGERMCDILRGGK